MHTFADSSCPVPPSPPPPGGSLTIRRAHPADLAATARLHIDLLPVGLFPALGPRFVRRWHAVLLSCPQALVLVAVDAAGMVRGFLLGTVDHRRYMHHLVGDKRTVVVLAVHGVVALVMRPSVCMRFLRTRARPWLRALLAMPGRPRRGRQSGGADAPVVAVLMAVAVDPDLRGHRVGTALTERFESDAAARGAHLAELITGLDDRAGSATGFYDRHGWTRTHVRLDRDGHRVQGYRKNLQEGRS